MKKPNLFCRVICCYLSLWFAFPVSVWADLTVNPPSFPDSSTVRVTLDGADSGDAHIIFWTPELLTNMNDWSRVVTGSVGQTTFDFELPTNAASFFRAAIAPVSTPVVATPVLTPVGGSYPHATNVVITCATDGASVYFTTNGSTPTTVDSFIYSGSSVFLDRSTALKAKAFKFGYDDSGVASESYTINHAPQVFAGEQQIIGSSPATLAGVVSDDGLTGGGIRFTNWSKVSGPGTVTFGNAGVTNTTASLSADGIYVLRLSCSDGQYTNSSEVTIALNPALSVALIEPEEGWTMTVPTNFLLKAMATTTSGSVTQVLFYTGTTLIGAAAGEPFTYEWKSVPAGNHALKAVAVSSSDDHYKLASDSVNITVNWPTNVGQVTLGLTDLQLPAAGLPIAVNRLYDTRSTEEGAFGQKWRLDWEDARIESDSMTYGWEGYGSILRCVRETASHLVTVTLGEGEKYYFAARVVFNSNNEPCVNISTPLGYYNVFAHLEFESLTGQGQLSLSAPGNLGLTPTGYDPGDGCLGTWFGPLKLATFEEDGFEICEAYASDWNPALSGFTFTAPDGMRYTFDGDGRLSQKIDRNNNSLTYSSGSIYHSSGRQVTFTRDGNNRITEIYDPIAQETSGSPALKYDYDSNGNLTNVARLIERSGPVYENTAYAYTNANYPHHITSITDARPVVSARYEYDSSGRLHKQFDALNRSTTYTYDTANRRQIVTDKLNNSIIQNFTLSGQVASVQDAENGVTSYTYDERGRRVTETNPLNQQTTYGYDENDQLTGVTNELNETTRATYNEFGQVLESYDARNHGTTNSYDDYGNLLFVTNALGVVAAYGYDYQGNRVAETNALGLPEQTHTLYAYNGYGDLTKVTDALGNETDYTPDSNGNRLTESRTRTLPDSSPETLLTQRIYDAANRVIQTIGPANNTNRVGYNAINKQSFTADALNRTNRYFYDAVGLLTNTTYADGLFERFSYDAEGRRTQSVDRGNRTNSYAYDAVGRLTRTTFADTSHAASHYNAAGRLIRSTQAATDGGLMPALELSTYFFYDAAGRRTSVINELNQTTGFDYDANGNQTHVVDALNRTNRYEYDPLNRQTKLLYPDNSMDSYGYDGLDRRIAVTNQAGIVTRFGFDALGRLVAVTNAFGTSQAMVTRYTYDEVGNLIEQIDSLNRTNRFEYDSLGRRTRETMPGNQSQSFAYDPVGNLTLHTNFNGVVLTNKYDSLNRLTNKASAGGYQITYAYSPTSQRTQMVDASGTTTYTHDSRDRLLTKSTPQGTLTYTYNTFGNLSRIESDTTGGTRLTYRYDGLNRLTNVVDRYTNNTFYTFDAVGNLQTARHQNNVTNTYAYNTLNRLTNITARSAAGTIASFAYRLAPAGNRTNLMENINGTARTNVWQYDPLYRLTNEVITGASPVGAISYKYDAVGNRTNRTSSVAGVSTVNSSFNGNDQLTTDTYDNNGSTTASGGIPYAYDVENRLTNYNSGAATFIYDGDGNRVRKTAGGVTTFYLVDDRNPTGYAQVLEERTSTATNLYTYGLDLTCLSTLNPQLSTVFYGYDGNGNVRYLTAANATVSDTYAYDAFGIQIASTGSTPNNYRYSGEQLDPNLGFYYLRARYMNPSTGRFWTRDTYAGSVFDPPSLHRYLYVKNNPISGTDPSGFAEAGGLAGTLVVGEGYSRLVTIKLSAITIAYTRAVATAAVIALTLRGDRKDGNYVYRRLSDSQTATAYLQLGIIASNPTALLVMPSQHIEGNTPYGSPWISTSRNYEVPLKQYRNNPNNPIIKIDLTKVPTVVLDFTNPAVLSTLQSDMARGLAARDSEVLIFGFVPAQAIVGSTAN